MTRSPFIDAQGWIQSGWKTTISKKMSQAGLAIRLITTLYCHPGEVKDSF